MVLVNCVLCGGDCGSCDQTRQHVVVIPMASLSVDERQSVMDYVTINIGDGTTFTIQSGNNGCSAGNGRGCTYIYYVLSNSTTSYLV